MLLAHASAGPPLHWIPYAGGPAGAPVQQRDRWLLLLDAVESAVREQEQQEELLAKKKQRRDARDAAGSYVLYAAAEDEEAPAKRRRKPTTAVAAAMTAPTPGPSARAPRAQQPGGPCAHCGATESPQWRRPVDSAITLCNACGLHLARHRALPRHKAKTPFVAAAAIPHPHDVPTAAAAAALAGVHHPHHPGILPAAPTSTSSADSSCLHHSLCAPPALQLPGSLPGAAPAPSASPVAAVPALATPAAKERRRRRRHAESPPPALAVAPALPPPPEQQQHQQSARICAGGEPCLTAGSASAAAPGSPTASSLSGASCRHVLASAVPTELPPQQQQQQQQAQAVTLDTTAVHCLAPVRAHRSVAAAPAPRAQQEQAWTPGAPATAGASRDAASAVAAVVLGMRGAGAQLPLLPGTHAAWGALPAALAALATPPQPAMFLLPSMRCAATPRVRRLGSGGGAPKRRRGEQEEEEEEELQQRQQRVEEGENEEEEAEQGEHTLAMSQGSTHCCPPATAASHEPPGGGAAQPAQGPGGSGPGAADVPILLPVRACRGPSLRALGSMGAPGLAP